VDVWWADNVTVAVHHGIDVAQSCPPRRLPGGGRSDPCWA